jgi:curved DNA-binding protein CbpA
MSTEKRRFQRYHKEVAFTLEFGGKKYAAITEDYSVDGLSVLVDGTPSIKSGDIINLDISKINLKSGGKVMRVSNANGVMRLGISRLGLLHGALSDFDISDILLGLQRSSKTGVIFLRINNIQKTIYFKGGDMIFAASNLVEDRLGEMLVREGSITADDYKRSSDVVRREKKRHGAVLVEMGIIKAKDLFEAVKRSVENIILSALSFRDGDFLFKEGELPTDEVITLKLSAANLIYRGVKAIRDIEIIKSLCPGAEDVLSFSSDPLNLFQDLKFEQGDRKILSIVDGKNTFRQIIEASGMGPLDAMASVSALLCTRIIEIRDMGAEANVHAEDISFSDVFHEHQEEQQKKTDAKPSAKVKKDVSTVDEDMEDGHNENERLEKLIIKVDEMHKVCEESDYYHVLDVDKRATSTLIKRAYYTRAKEYHPDKHLGLPDKTREKLNSIFTSITSAYSTLSSIELRIQYDRDPMKGRAHVLDPAARAEQKFNSASNLMRKGRYDEAATMFAEAAYLDSEMPSYHYHSSLALANSGKHKEAERTIQRAIKLEPFNAEYLAELGHIYLALGLNLRAKSNFEKALKISSMHKRAMEGLSALPDE